MRKITIHQGSSVIEILDNSENSDEDYCKELSKIFEANNISLLQTSHATVILRPSKLTGIVVENFPSLDQSDEVSEETVSEDKSEDVIMDVD